MLKLRKSLTKVAGIILLLFLLTSFVSADEEKVVFEKGDAIYSDLKGYLIPGTHIPYPSWFLGHAGLYWKWEDIKDGEPNDPEDWTTHKTIESKDKGPDVYKFQKFYKTGKFWGVWTPKKRLTAAQRRTIVDTAESQIDDNIKYAFFKGWKKPGKSFRCDGLVEYCYRKVGITLLPGEKWWWSGWRHRSPKRQMKSGVLKKRTEADAPEIGEITRDSVCEITVPVTDGPYGSGMTMVVVYAEVDWENPTKHFKEAWYNNNDCDKEKENCIYSSRQKYVNFKCDAAPWEQPCNMCATGRDKMRVECFDQAGNKAETDWNWEWTLGPFCNPPPGEEECCTVTVLGACCLLD